VKKREANLDGEVAPSASPFLRPPSLLNANGSDIIQLYPNWNENNNGYGFMNIDIFGYE
jgi:hypothetical protein